MYLTEFWFIGSLEGVSPSAPYGALAAAAALRVAVLVAVVVLAVRDHVPDWMRPSNLPAE